DDPVQRCPDIELAKRELGWEPRVPLREGLKRTIEYFDHALAMDRCGRRGKRRLTAHAMAPSLATQAPEVEAKQVSHVSR
ncbi:MAG TPA: hypothetical protein VIL32_02055, partial [Steroidobacteraceae bacterium]